ncbi:MAG: hypothetical protein P8Y70_07430 [Candidatus Lokiarchaeota archaeon]
MVTFSWIKNIFQKAKQRNVLAGIIISGISTFILFLITFQIYFLYIGDLQLLVGINFGVWFTLRYLKPDKSALKTGILAGLLGGLFSVLVLSLYEWIIFTIWTLIFSLLELIYIISWFLLQGVIIGLIMGGLVGYYYWRKEDYKRIKKRDNKKEYLVDEDFFDKLKED